LNESFLSAAMSFKSEKYKLVCSTELDDRSQEVQSTSENDFECFASTGVNTPKEPLNNVACSCSTPEVMASSDVIKVEGCSAPVASAPCVRLGGFERHYAAVIPSSFLRARNKFTSAQVANSRFAFFAIPR
jgi:hypothetical protein